MTRCVFEGQFRLALFYGALVLLTSLGMLIVMAVRYCQDRFARGRRARSRRFARGDVATPDEVAELRTTHNGETTVPRSVVVVVMPDMSLSVGEREPSVERLKPLEPGWPSKEVTDCSSCHCSSQGSTTALPSPTDST